MQVWNVFIILRLRKIDDKDPPVVFMSRQISLKP